jgi:PAS domain S-box-containing protein
MRLVERLNHKRYSVLLAYALGLVNPLTNTDNLERAKELFEEVTPLETFVLVDAVVKKVAEIDTAKVIVLRLLNSFGNSLNRHKRPFRRDFPFIEELLVANDKIEAILEDLKPVITKVNGVGYIGEEPRQIFCEAVEQLSHLIKYYEYKENILFPEVEKRIEDSRCLTILWAIHDDVRLTLRLLQGALNEENYSLASFNRLIGKLFFDLKTIIFREEQILIPVVYEILGDEVLLKLGEGQLMEGQVKLSALKGGEERVDLVTGEPTVAQLLEIFNNLPVDITLVDSEDRVVYFNTPAGRIFPRAKAVVGRTVQNCHPPTSLNLVEEILATFKAKEEEYAEFRIEMNGRLILITYRAIYGEDGSYRGTMEVSQDITDLKEMEGEHRLLDWRK